MRSVRSGRRKAIALFQLRPISGGGIDVYSLAADGSGTFDPIGGAASAQTDLPFDLTADGSGLLLYSGGDLAVVSLEDGSVAELTNNSYQERRAVLSPDGRSIAYQSDESGEQQVWVRPFPDFDGRQQVSTAGGFSSRWVGNEIFYRYQDGVFVVETADDPGDETRLLLSRSRLLFLRPVCPRRATQLRRLPARCQHLRHDSSRRRGQCSARAARRGAELARPGRAPGAVAVVVSLGGGCGDVPDCTGAGVRE